MRTNAAALGIIKRNEGLRLDAYQDVVGVWTIGYGDTGPAVRPGLRITAEDAEQRLRDRLAREFEPGVQAAIGRVPTTENQFGAMVSLAYNIGVGAFKYSTVARMHKAGRHQAAADAFAAWNKAGGKVFAGLTRRRQEEADLYLRRDATAAETIAVETASPPVAGDNPIDLIRRAQRALGVAADGDPGPVTRSKASDYRAAHPGA